MTSVSNPPEPIRVAVAGLGRSGWGIHLQTFQRMTEKYRVVGVADTDAGRVAETAMTMSCASYPTVEAMLADTPAELVVVATPNKFHATHAVAALQAGKGVVCEKPFGLTVAETDSMIEAARASGVVLAPFQNRRFEASFEKVREIIASGRIGQVVHIRMAYHSFGRRWDWQTLRKYGGGQLNNNAPHPLDQALLLYADHGVTDPEKIAVFADLCNTLSSGDAEDHVRITLKAEGAPTLDIEFTAACAFPQDQWLVMGTSGGIRGTSKQLSVKWVDWSVLPPRPVQEASTPDRGYNREPVEWNEETHECSDSGVAAGHDRFYNGLFATLRENAPLLIRPEEIRNRIAVIEKARAAAGGVPART